MSLTQSIAFSFIARPTSMTSQHSPATSAIVRITVVRGLCRREIQMIIQTQTKDEEYERLTPLHFDATEKNLAIFRFGHAFDLVGPLRKPSDESLQQGRNASWFYYSPLWFNTFIPLHFDATEKNLAIFRFGHAFDLVGPLRKPSDESLQQGRNASWFYYSPLWFNTFIPLHFDATEKNLAIFRFGHAFDLVGPLRKPSDESLQQGRNASWFYYSPLWFNTFIPLHFDATEKNLAIFRFGHAFDLVGPLRKPSDESLQQGRNASWFYYSPLWFNTFIPLHFDATEKNLAIFRFGHAFDLVGPLRKPSDESLQQGRNASWFYYSPLWFNTFIPLHFDATEKNLAIFRFGHAFDLVGPLRKPSDESLQQGRNASWFYYSPLWFNTFIPLHFDATEKNLAIFRFGHAFDLVGPLRKPSDESLQQGRNASWFYYSPLWFNTFIPLHFDATEKNLAIFRFGHAFDLVGPLRKPSDESLQQGRNASWFYYSPLWFNTFIPLHFDATEKNLAIFRFGHAFDLVGPLRKPSDESLQQGRNASWFYYSPLWFNTFIPLHFDATEKNLAIFRFGHAFDLVGPLRKPSDESLQQGRNASWFYYSPLWFNTFIPLHFDATEKNLAIFRFGHAFDLVGPLRKPSDESLQQGRNASWFYYSPLWFNTFIPLHFDATEKNLAIFRFGHAFDLVGPLRKPSDESLQQGRNASWFYYSPLWFNTFIPLHFDATEKNLAIFRFGHAFDLVGPLRKPSDESLQQGRNASWFYYSPLWFNTFIPLHFDATEKNLAIFRFGHAFDLVGPLRKPSDESLQQGRNASWFYYSPSPSWPTAIRSSTSTTISHSSFDCSEPTIWTFVSPSGITHRFVGKRSSPSISRRRRTTWNSDVLPFNCTMTSIGVHAPISIWSSRSSGIHWSTRTATSHSTTSASN